jgi:hypothetical protein
MKQAKADAKELIDVYRAEKQAEFNNKVLSAGKFWLFIKDVCNESLRSTGCVSTFISKSCL